MSAQTMAEKILSRAAGHPVTAGEFIEVRPDRCFTVDDTIGLIMKYHAEAGIDRLTHPERLGIFCDHYAPADSREHASDHSAGRAYARLHGLKDFFEVGTGTPPRSAPSAASAQGWVRRKPPMSGRPGASGSRPRRRSASS